MRYRIRYVCLSDIGKCRSKNQDNFICDGAILGDSTGSSGFTLAGCATPDPVSLFGVFDGMGGEECGEVASLIAAKTAAALSIDGEPLGGLLDYCTMANERICNYAEKNGVSSMGTTAALLVFTQNDISLCNIGDSKVFRLSGGKLEQISMDHYGIGVCGRKPPLSQNLGIPASEMVIDPYVAKGCYADGDIYLLCSDGLTDMVSPEGIARLLANTGFDKAANALVEAALENGGKDNVTVILCRVQRESRSFIDRVLRRK